MRILLVALLCFYYAAVSPYFLYHNDIGWHLAAGDWIVATHHIPATDPWSYTAGDTPWINMAWLWDVLASLVFHYAGFMGLLIATLAIGVATLCLLATLATRLGAHPAVTLIVASYVGMVFPFYEPPDIFLCVAPQQITLLFSAWLLLLLQEFVKTHRRVYYAVIPLLVMLWCNMHGGFVIAPVMIGAVALCARDAKLALILVLSVAAMLVNPYGIHIMSGVLGTLGNIYQSHISEWQPLYKHGISVLFLMPSLIYTAVFLGSLRWKNISPFQRALTLLSLLLLIKGIFTLRYFSLFLLLSIPLAARGLSRRQTATPACPYPLAALAVIAAMSVVIMRLANPAPIAMADIRDPKAEIDFTQQHYPHARIFNHYNYGGFLIYESGGTLKPFVDGRLGTAYPDRVFIDLQRFEASGDWQGIIDAYHIDLILWPKSDGEKLAWFARHPEWKTAFTGKLATVLVRNR